MESLPLFPLQLLPVMVFGQAQYPIRTCMIFLILRIEEITSHALGDCILVKLKILKRISLSRFLEYSLDGFMNNLS